MHTIHKSRLLLELMLHFAKHKKVTSPEDIETFKYAKEHFQLNDVIKNVENDVQKDDGIMLQA